MNLRRLALGALSCALIPFAALAGTVSGSVANGQLSSALSVSAGTVVSFTFVGQVPIDQSATGANISRTCFTIMRSQDGSNFAPLARDATGAFAHYCGPITIDLTESRSGTYYALQADPGAPSFAYRIDQ